MESEIKAGAKVVQTAHPEYGTWTISEPCPGVPGMWHVRKPRGEIVVDAAELAKFWKLA